MEIFIAFYFSGVGIAMYKIWYPSYMMIKEIDPNNIMTYIPWISHLVVLILFTVFLPVMLFALLFDDHTERFINAFVKGAAGEEK